MSRTHQTVSFARCCLLWLAVTVGSGTVLVLVSPDLPDLPHVGVRDRQRIDEIPFDSLLTTGCAVALGACACWLWLVTTLTALEALTGLPLWRAGCPDALRRGVLTACGVALVAGATPLVPASADTSAGLPPSTPTPGRSDLAGLQVPDRATAGQPAAAIGPVGPSTDSVVRIAPGDTLWALARDRLPQSASDADIADGWHEIWEANRDRIGPDPDLIHPGGVLRLPVPKEHP